jgi:hypothetical protein
MARKMAHRDRDDYGDLVGAIAHDRHARFTFSPLLLHKPVIFNAILSIDSSRKGIDIEGCDSIGRNTGT